MATAQVARGTTLFFFSGRVIHKLTAPDGGEYVLFSMSQDQTPNFDPFALNGLAGMSVPTGWVYSSEVITEQLSITTPTGIAEVYSTPDFWTWQRLASVAEPGIALLVTVGLVALGARRRRT